ncbi:MotA/TolQ/ExbB proton channel family protein [Simkania negevensis]|uniref:MotA/TolQ/ExbB proton channel family protein n=1 Tax=Simkania negevensis TaxID=83561 RepID=A0ABS3ASX4_9BACT|nr:MotA/TolQ/ExbB proton channel family protein [Simkania negevensis]
MFLIDTPLFLSSLWQTLFQLSDLNIILVVIGACSILSFTIFIERVIYLKRSEKDTNQLIISLRKSIQEGNISQAIQVCEETGGSVASIIKAGLLKNDQDRKRIENAMEIKGMLEIAQLEKNAKVLSILGHITPLIGLLGTVLGFIEAFSEMRRTGLMDISTTRIGEAMEYALVTTAAGLVVAIPTVVAYNYIISRVKGLVLEMQTTSSEIVDLLLQDPHEVQHIS